MMRRCPCRNELLEACVLWAGHRRRCIGPALPRSDGPLVGWPGLVVQRDARLHGLEEAMLYAVASTLTWQLLPRSGLTGWPHDALLVASVVILVFAWRGLAIFEASCDWLDREAAA